MSSLYKDAIMDCNQAEYFNRVKQYPKAVISYTRAAKKVKFQNAETYVKWGTSLHEQFKYKEAARKFSQSVQICSRYCWVYDKWGFSLLYLGKYDEALAKFQEATRIDPLMKFYKVNCSLVLFIQGKVLEAKDILINTKNMSTIYVSQSHYFYEDEISNQKVRLEKAKDEEEAEIVKNIIRGIEWIIENTKTWKAFC